MAPMLEQEEVRRRIRAARVLLDISQADMNQAGAERGLRKHELGAAERGDIEIRHYHLPMLCEILEVPMSWFTEPREAVVQVPPRNVDDVLGELQRWLKGQGPAGEGSGQNPTRRQAP